MVQPNSTVTTYALPSDIQLGNGCSVSDEVSRARRVQQQVQMRLAEKPTLPRQNGSVSHYAMSDYGGSSTLKYQTYNPSFSSKSSYVYTGSRTMGPRVSQRSGFSCQSAGPDLAHFQGISVAGGGAGAGGVSGGGGFYREEVRMGNYQGNSRHQREMDPETLSVHSMRLQTVPVNPWLVDGSDVGSLVSERDATYSRQYAQSTINGYTSQARQGGGSMTFPMRRSLSGTLSRSGGMTGGETEIIQHQSFRGPAHRTISRIANRNRIGMGSVSGTLQRPVSAIGCAYGRGGDVVDRGFISAGLSSGSQGNLVMSRPGTLSRAMSIKSMHSVGQMDLGASISNLSGIHSLDMPTAVQHLRESDKDLQVLGAAYIQHECYNDNEAKNEVRRLKGIHDLVRLFNSENLEVQRYATGAARNLIYENMDNKVALIEEDGISQLVEALKEKDDEVRKNITGILWNLSSKDQLKEKLARETLSDLTEWILLPLTGGGDSEEISQSPSQTDIFYNATGCLRNLSSVTKVRQQMRQTPCLVDSLVAYIKASLDDNRAEDKGVENTACILRNLSYQLYSEMPPSVLLRLEGPTRAQSSGKGDAIGCFTPQSRKAKNSKNQDLSTFTEVARVPKGAEWLWHPQIVALYNRLLHQCEINSTTREAAAGALQNITAGDKRWASVLSRVALEQERMLPVVLDLLRTTNDLELRSLTGFLRNLSRHTRDKGDMATKTVSNLVAKLPADAHAKEPSSDVVLNICGILNNLVTGSSLAARDIAFFDGLTKLVAIKNSGDSSPGKMKTSKAAATVLSNMFHYKKLHKQYKEKGFTRTDFTDMTM